MMAEPLLQEALPEFADELRALLEKDGLIQLAEQVASLRIVDRCRCGEESCASFFTVPKPEGAWGAGHENIVLDADEGMLVLDAVGGKIVHVEILDRDEIRKKLLRQIP
jgi:hypothetical protein